MKYKIQILVGSSNPNSHTLNLAKAIENKLREQGIDSLLDPFPNSKKSFIDLEYGSQLKLLPKIPPISGREISQNDRAI